MNSIQGTILTKDPSNTKIEIVVEDNLGVKYAFQVRPHKYQKLIPIDTKDYVMITYKNEMSEVRTNRGTKRINNLILIDIKKF